MKSFWDKITQNYFFLKLIYIYHAGGSNTAGPYPNPLKLF